MAKENSGVRFDHREIAVILSLFVFVSILMFTVGILVGKGISQRHADAGKVSGGLAAVVAESGHGNPHEIPSGTSVSTDHAPDAHAEAKPAHDDHGKADEHGKPEEHKVAKHEEDSHDGPPSEAVAPAEKREPASDDKHDVHAEAKPAEPLKLIPKGEKTNDSRGELQEFPKSKELTAVIKNPKLQSIYEPSTTKNRGTASVAPVSKTPPQTFAEGKYTVQVGSYPSQKEAEERVATLKKLGFPHSFFSAKELTKDTWYRVWLGYFPDADTAKQGGELLQARGEVKNYLVRRSDNKD